LKENLSIERESSVQAGGGTERSVGGGGGLGLN